VVVLELHALTKDDMELITAAEVLIERLFEHERHHVAAALRTKSGRIFTAVNIEAYVNRISVCAESIVIGKAISEGEKDFETIVAVRHPCSDEKETAIKVVSPCGMCREVIYDYGPDSMVIIPFGDKTVKCHIGELLPIKYKRHD
jgi:cytidine deaminase